MTSDSQQTLMSKRRRDHKEKARYTFGSDVFAGISSEAAFPSQLIILLILLISVITFAIVLQEK